MPFYAVFLLDDLLVMYRSALWSVMCCVFVSCAVSTQANFFYNTMNFSFAEHQERAEPLLTANLGEQGAKFRVLLSGPMPNPRREFGNMK
jgi:hypothetical protein